MDTIFALSSGTPPAGIGVVRISGPRAGDILDRLTRRARPPARHAALRSLRDPLDGRLLDRALVLWFPGPETATGEDLAEFHLHGGRAVIAAVLDCLRRENDTRAAVAGEFTRRAFEAGRIDLIETEALGDLLAAETEGQRRNAVQLADGKLSRAIGDWQRRLLALSARVEAMLDFADDDDVDGGFDPSGDLAALRADIERWRMSPPVERLRDGVRVVLAGPPNAGKSTLLNALAGREAAIVTDIAGTTRDLIEIPVAIGGIGFLVTDTAGLRGETGDAVEAIGIDRARRAIDAADILIWLGDPATPPTHPRTIRVGAQCDRRSLEASDYDVLLSAVTGVNLSELVERLLHMAATLLPAEGEIALNARQRVAIDALAGELADASTAADPVLVAEGLRAARAALDALTGQSGTEQMFDALFGAFCIGK